MSNASPLKTLKVGSLQEWHAWLKKNHRISNGIWLVFKKKEAGPVPFDYGMALDEALSFGWVDSLIKAIDEKEYLRKFTPRKASSSWSEHNKKRVARLMEQGRMQPFGMEKVEAARENGMWEKKVVPPAIDQGIPGALLHAFERHPKARACYFALGTSHQKQYNMWINSARRADTVHRRVEESIRILESGESLGLK